MLHAIAMPIEHAALCRLNALAPLDDAAISAIRHAAARARSVPAEHELLVEGEEIAHPLLILRGWAARVRIFPSGRRQILSLLLPGDLIGHCGQSEPCAVSTVIALTDLAVAIAPRSSVSTALHEAYAISAAVEEAYLLAHIARLGRLSAHERICDLLLELLERLQLAGLADETGFDLPLTQEKLADMLGLTAVHVNRMLQLARKQGELSLKSGRLTLNAPAALADRIGRRGFAGSPPGRGLTGRSRRRS
jgi:CRP-like cAMP-binding protein